MGHEFLILTFGFFLLFLLFFGQVTQVEIALGDMHQFLAVKFIKVLSGDSRKSTFERSAMALLGDVGLGISLGAVFGFDN